MNDTAIMFPAFCLCGMMLLSIWMKRKRFTPSISRRRATRYPRRIRLGSEPARLQMSQEYRVSGPADGFGNETLCKQLRPARPAIGSGDEPGCVFIAHPGDQEIFRCHRKLEQRHAFKMLDQPFVEEAGIRHGTGWILHQVDDGYRPVAQLRKEINELPD